MLRPFSFVAGAVLGTRALFAGTHFLCHFKIRRIPLLEYRDIVGTAIRRIIVMTTADKHDVREAMEQDALPKPLTDEPPPKPEAMLEEPMKDHEQQEAFKIIGNGAPV
jgi:hypothetical protein